MRESARSPACQDFVARSRNWSDASAVAADGDGVGDGDDGGDGDFDADDGTWCLQDWMWHDGDQWLRDFARGSG